MGHVPLVPWSIVSVDPAVRLTYAGRSPLLNVRRRKRPNVTHAATPGTSRPAAQWVHAGPEVVAFTVEVAGENMTHDLAPELNALRALTAIDPQVGRGPRVVWTWGRDTITGFVTAADENIASKWVTGLARAVVFELEITEAPDLVESAPTGETLYTRVADGDTFEGLGFRHTGDPLRGELIRRGNPALAQRELAAGDRVRILEADHPDMRKRVAAASVPLAAAGAAAEIEALAESRGTVNRAWALLPGVDLVV